MFTKPSNTAAQQALRMHTGRVHVKSIRTPDKAYWAAQAEKQMASASPTGKAVSIAEGRYGFTKTGKPRFKPYTYVKIADRKKSGRKQKYLSWAERKARGYYPPRKRDQSGATSKGRYIPIAERRTRTELEQLNNQSRLHFCPNCGFGLGQVALAMTVAERLNKQ